MTIQNKPSNALRRWNLPPESRQSILRLEAQVDIAPRQSLVPYDDGRQWIVVDDQQLMLGAVGHAMIRNDTLQMCKWSLLGWLATYPSLEAVAGDTFRVLWFEDAYVLARYPAGGHHG